MELSLSVEPNCEKTVELTARFIDYLMVIGTEEILWNLCGIYEKFLWKSMVPQHIVEGKCGIFVEIIRKYGGKSSSTVWNFKRIQ